MVYRGFLVEFSVPHHSYRIGYIVHIEYFVRQPSSIEAFKSGNSVPARGMPNFPSFPFQVSPFEPTKRSHTHLVAQTPPIITSLYFPNHHHRPSGTKCDVVFLTAKR